MCNNNFEQIADEMIKEMPQGSLLTESEKAFITIIANRLSALQDGIDALRKSASGDSSQVFGDCPLCEKKILKGETFIGTDFENMSHWSCFKGAAQKVKQEVQAASDVEKTEEQGAIAVEGEK